MNTNITKKIDNYDALKRTHKNSKYFIHGMSHKHYISHSTNCLSDT